MKYCKIKYKRKILSSQKEQLIISNNTKFLQQAQIRINGYLYKLVTLLPYQEKRFILLGVSPDHQVTVDLVEEDINLLLLENTTLDNKTFCKTLAADDVVAWRYDDGTLEADKIKHSQVPVDDEILYG